ncbi:DNA/RNA helicase domain-containing protein [Aeromicrobium sp. CF3.5]|uniref:DNA/RNA helicase domain-containing protein n=1 Tax=Aeromicrobium sp. CF3.5 TaxID=3373078 RepID=UPI003EE605C4
MTSSRIHRVPFERGALASWAATDPRSANWPVVYTIDGAKHVYVGETIHALSRMRQHLARADRAHLTSVRILVDEMFNKSVCLDLESFLIKRFSGDGKYEVVNANAGMTGSDYYQRETYREQFEQVFEQLRAEGLFDQSAIDIENSDMFKLSPYKELNYDQRTAILAILEQLFDDLRGGEPSTAVVEGQPGTGKTIVGIYLIKLLSDIKLNTSLIDADSDAIFAGFFTQENADLLAGFKMALVIPQQSLRKTVEKVFTKTSGLTKEMVLSPFQVGNLGEEYDLLIVDEAHRLQQLSATMPTLITKFKATNRRLFDGDEAGGNQLDWVRRMSQHRIFLLDPEQSIRPASDLPPHVVRTLAEEASTTGRSFALTSQMRVRAGQDYVAYVRSMLSATPPTPTTFGDYELALFDDLGDMRDAILARERQVGLSRLVAGYAWKWRSKTDKGLSDIEIDGLELQWNNTATDWISSPTSINEVGSVHTTQGYDLNYAGVIIGPDLRYDPVAKRLRIDRDSYYDGKGKANNKMLGFDYTDDDLLVYIRNIYAVLLTRGIRGTYVYVCDPDLREYLSLFLEADLPSNDDLAPGVPSFPVPDILHDTTRASPSEAAFDVELGTRASTTDQPR